MFMVVMLGKLHAKSDKIRDTKCVAYSNAGSNQGRAEVEPGG